MGQDKVTPPRVPARDKDAVYEATRAEVTRKRLAADYKKQQDLAKLRKLQGKGGRG